MRDCTLRGQIVIAVLLGLWCAPATADQQTPSVKTESDGALTVELTCHIQAPGVNAIIFAGQENPFPVDLVAANKCRIKGNGSNSVSTTWRVSNGFWMLPTEWLYSQTTNVNPSENIVVPANTNQWCHWAPVAMSVEAWQTAVGGHTLDSRVFVEALTEGYEDHDHNTTLTFSVVAS